LNARVMDTLAELGCFRLWIGSESGSQRVLDSMERGVTVQEVHTAISLAKSRGIKAGMFLMWGYEGEEIEDIQATVEHVKRSNPDTFLTTVSYPIKGTPYFQEVSSRLVSVKPWAQGSDRDYRIRDRHSRRFYEFADQLLRSEVELHRLLQNIPLEASMARSPTLESASVLREPMIAELRQKITQAHEGLRISANEVEA
jgi:anaerobic magnesium-protoporphyrin IX monomethyl ester cyclase